MVSVAEKPPADPLVGTIVDAEFRVEEKLGTGGMGNVYRAVQQLTERSVALKVIHPHLCDATMDKRFRQEAQIISRLSHPNIITVYKCGVHAANSLYIAMEYVQGRPLDSVLEQGRPMDVARALPLMIQMAGAVAYAHEQKIVHRDIKPENMILTRTGRTEAIKILDFGIAKIVDGNSALTKTGMLCGSPAYMAPEQWNQLRDIDGRTDIYALGCVYYEMLTGRQPFQAESVMGYMNAHVQGPPVRSPNDIVPGLAAFPALEPIVMRCLSRARADRFADAYSLVEALEGAQAQFASTRVGPVPVIAPAIEGAARPLTAAATRPVTTPHAPLAPARNAAPTQAIGMPSRANPFPLASPVAAPTTAGPRAGAGTQAFVAPAARGGNATQAFAPGAPPAPAVAAPVARALGRTASATGESSARPAAVTIANAPSIEIDRRAPAVVSTVAASPSADGPTAPADAKAAIRLADTLEPPVASSSESVADREITAPSMGELALEHDGESASASGAMDTAGGTDRLRAIEQDLRRQDGPATRGDELAETAAHGAARTHALLVATGTVMCAALGFAVWLLR